MKPLLVAYLVICALLFAGLELLRWLASREDPEDDHRLDTVDFAIVSAGVFAWPLILAAVGIALALEASGFLDRRKS